MKPFKAATLAGLYPIHAEYVDTAREVVARNLAAGYITDYDAAQTLWEAERSDIGGR